MTAAHPNLGWVSAASVYAGAGKTVAVVGWRVRHARRPPAPR